MLKGVSSFNKAKQMLLEHIIIIIFNVPKRNRHFLFNDILGIV